MGQGGGFWNDWLTGLKDMATGGQGGAMPGTSSPASQPMMTPPKTELPGYSGGYGINLFGRMSPEDLTTYNQQNNIPQPAMPTPIGSTSSPSGGLWGKNDMFSAVDRQYAQGRNK